MTRLCALLVCVSAVGTARADELPSEIRENVAAIVRKTAGRSAAVKDALVRANRLGAETAAHHVSNPNSTKVVGVASNGDVTSFSATKNTLTATKHVDLPGGQGSHRVEEIVKVNPLLVRTKTVDSLRHAVGRSSHERVITTKRWELRLPFGAHLGHTKTTTRVDGVKVR